ncbi:restriction endonuclease subunit S [Noviherbaspirillum sp. CPCC 100848]|uniref:Restriction endonuclease subunit S n=1 Tax=Noviherbaspirillum album TaxID=3080276 RepID=A0ABU6JJD3_9BURK|nr:restriction endonuclease subunit S [Noviherbaspirillum sp. CPCC 100848]MEC4723282.1 restriction endonuclease subunit S [Noviherbaspirillum sp. CPCC 100848]
MDARQFLAEFGDIANAPEGIERLRMLVLQLAVQGRLFKSLSPWRPYVLSEIGRWGSGGTPARTHSDYYNGDIPWLVIGDLNDGVVMSASGSITQKGLENSSAKLIPPGALLIGMYGSIGKLGITGMACTTNQAIAHCIVNELVALTRYIFIFIRANRDFLFAQGKGLAQQNISQTILKAQKIELPSLEEQSLIVAKVDELMALCDKMEAQQQARRKLQNALRQSTLQALASATSPYELQTTWARLADNFRQLFHAPEDVAELRNLILDLAATGFLSEPETDDGDPLEILGHASRQQKMEFSAREIREINALPEPTYANGRVRIALGRIVKLVSGQHLSPDEYNTRQDGIPYITGPAEFKDRRPSPTKWTTERRAVARAGDVLITVKGSGVGKNALCDLEELAISRQLMAIRSLGDLDRSYLSICIDSAERSFQEQKFGIAIPGIGRDEVLGLPVLLPSIEEQGRIVKRVDELLRLCDSLELQLRNAQKLAERLVVASVSSLTGIAIEQDEEPMKAPQIELIAPLRLGMAPDIKAQAPLANILARHNGEMGAKDLWQRFGGEIDAFYAQVKTEVAHGWILEPAPAEVREKKTDAVSA